MPLTIQKAIELDNESSRIIQYLKSYEGDYNPDWGVINSHISVFCDRVELIVQQDLSEKKYTKANDKILETWMIDFLTRAKTVSIDKNLTLKNVHSQIETKYALALQKYQDFSSKYKSEINSQKSPLTNLSEDQINQGLDRMESKFDGISDGLYHKELVESTLVKERLSDIISDYVNSYDAFIELLAIIKSNQYPHVGIPISHPKIKLSPAGIEYLGEQLMKKGYIKEIPKDFLIEIFTRESEYRIMWLKQKNELAQFIDHLKENGLLPRYKNPPYAKFEVMFIDTNENPIKNLRSNIKTQKSATLNSIIQEAQKK